MSPVVVRRRAVVRIRDAAGCVAIIAHIIIKFPSVFIIKHTNPGLLASRAVVNAIYLIELPVIRRICQRVVLRRLKMREVVTRHIVGFSPEQIICTNIYNFGACKVFISQAFRGVEHRQRRFNKLSVDIGNIQIIVSAAFVSILIVICGRL